LRKMPAKFPSRKEQYDIQETGRIFCLGHLWIP
jgi:hypothetical protein